MIGIWAVLEGPDGAGKSATTKLVAAELKKRRPELEIVETKHPGSTHLGAHIREFTKHPDKFGFEIDPLSAQMLMFTDHINFKNVILLPALARGAIVLGDRCDLVSGLAYGKATGVSADQINMLLALACQPRVDALYVLTCDDATLDARIAARAEVTDRFESIAVRRLVADAYRRLTHMSPDKTMMLNHVVALDDVHHIDASKPIDDVVKRITDSILRKHAQANDD